MPTLTDTSTGEANASVTIMLVEDDPEVERRVTLALRRCGYQVVIATTGAEARALLSAAKPDLIIMDLMLPDTDGLLLTESFQALTRAHILICSGRHERLDRVLGLKLGAADFLAKPFDMDELEARVEALLRRSQRRPGPAPSDQICIGEMVIEPSRGTVKLDGRSVHLTPTEYHLLQTLASQPETVFARSALTQKVWGYPDLDCGHLVDVHVGHLRMKLRVASPDGGWVVTVRGRGYRLTGSTDPTRTEQAAPTGSAELGRSAQELSIRVTA
jgi:DNA-binding response OmpR family regulator